MSDTEYYTGYGQKPCSHDEEVWPIGDLIRSQCEILDYTFGGCGIVYKVKDIQDDIFLAVKTYRSRYKWDDDILDLFTQETKTWSDLGRHINIVNALFVQSIRGQPCIFMEFVEGGTLESRIRKALLAHKQIIEFAIQFCVGMNHALKLSPNIVHHDIKPSNILVTHNNTLKISDWGLARTTQKLTGKSSFGTPPYSSPEQSSGNADTDTRSDIYSFGVMLYRMLTCRLPSVEKGGVQPPRKLNPNMSDIINGLVMACMETQPKNRPQNFAQIESDLIRYYNKLHGEFIPGEVMLDAYNHRYWVNRSSTFTDMGRYDDAINACDEALKLKRNEPAALLNKGIALELSDRHEEAITCYAKALENKIDRIMLKEMIFNNMGNALSSINRFDEALSAYDEALAINPNYDMAWNNKGYLLMANLNRPNEAMHCFEAAVGINSNYDSAWNHMGLAFQHMGDSEKAIQCYDRAIGINDRHCWAIGNKAGAFMHLDRFEEAIALCDKVLELTPDNYYALNNKGVCLKALGRIDEALLIFERAINEGRDYDQQRRSYF